MHCVKPTNAKSSTYACIRTRTTIDPHCAIVSVLESCHSSTIEIESRSVEFILESAIEASEVDCVHTKLTTFYRVSFRIFVKGANVYIFDFSRV